MQTEREDLAVPLAQRTLPALLLRQAACHGERPFVRIPGARWRHADAPQVAARAGAALRAAGIGAGDRVALVCGNRAEALEVVLGCGWIGAVAVPLNTASMAPQLAYALEDSAARLLVIETAYVDRLAGIDFARTKLDAIRVVGAASERQEAKPGAGAPRAEPWSLPDEDSAATSAALRPGDPLAILYTSGTTGPAKGVICPHAQIHAWGTNTARILGIGPGDVLATTLPLFHVNALNTVIQAAVAGAEAVFDERFSASRYWSGVQASGATVIYLLGAMVPILLAQPESAAERGHRVRIGLGPGVPVAAGRAFEARTGVRLLEGYGSTETNFVIAAARDLPADGSMGVVQPGFQARVVDADDVELPPGAAGELVLRADEPWAFANGYFGKAEATVEAWRNLWFHTGDRVVREADGRFRFLDRIKDAIRRRGENISAHEVEQVLLGHPAVAAAAVFPVRSELAEDEVMATLVAREGTPLDPVEVAAFCASRLPRHAIPRYIDVVADLPHTENGKVQKYRLRERGVGPGTWDRGAGRRRETSALAKSTGVS